MIQPTKLETAAIKAVLHQADPEMSPLNHNIDLLKVVKREISDNGFQTSFDLGCQPELPIKRKLIHNDVFAEIEGLTHGAGFIIHLDNGRIKSLECVCYGDHSNNSDFNGAFAIRASHCQNHV